MINCRPAGGSPWVFVVMKNSFSDYIKIRGARQHNLKNVNIDIPKNKLVVLTGVSGSGKSSLAFDTIYAEGQRRYVESLSTYARQFLGVMGKPDVDLIEGLSPSISIDQKTVSHNPRSTVGTVTEIYDYLRLLFARIGQPHCPVCGREIASQSVDEIVRGMLEKITGEIKRNKIARYMILSPIIKDRKGEFSSLLDNLKSKGIRMARIDGQIRDLQDSLVLIKTNKHTIEAVIDKISVEKKNLPTLAPRLSEAVEKALKMSDGLAILTKVGDKSFNFPDFPKEMEDSLYSERFSCPVDNISLPDIEPRSFSFNSPHGACPECSGLGKKLVVDVNSLFAPELTIKEGGIIPYSSVFEHDTWFSRLILEVCRANNIETQRPLKHFTKEQKDLLSHGTGTRSYVVKGANRQGAMTQITETFPGVVAELVRRHGEAGSDYARAETEKYMKEMVCEKCHGTRLNREALAVTIGGLSIHDVSALPIKETLKWAQGVRTEEVGKLIISEIKSRLGFLVDVGLDYLGLARSANTLAGGEAQRIRLASQVGSKLTGVLYVLDEPTIGLHPRDNDRLINTLKKMRDIGNSVIVVEHDRNVTLSADYIVDFGPGAGKNGGEVVAHGTSSEIMRDKNSLTGKYLSGKRKIMVKSQNSRPDNNGKLKIVGAAQFNLKNIDVEFPLGKLVVVTGVSGSGKSTLVVETLYHALSKKLNPYHQVEAGAHRGLEGYELCDKAVLIDQSPIGRTPRSNPATYTKVFDGIRDVYAGTRGAGRLGFKKGRFSFNVKGGRCEHCEGQGQKKIEMQFMPDVWVVCEICNGARYNSQTLEVAYKEKNVADVLKMTVDEAIDFFRVFSQITRKLETLRDVGLGYIELGQPATTLSGGEAQRVKLATELARRDTGSTVYILDEPTTGLHFADMEKLMMVLRTLADRGNTVIVIEHNTDVIKNCDWIIDLGPEGGENGGRLITTGTPEQVSKDKRSITAKYL